MLVAVGSTNPVKINAVEKAFKRFWEDVEVLSVKVSSGVSDEPVGVEAVVGARNRARSALKLLNADFGVGIEGGLFKLANTYYCAGFVWIERKDGAYSTGMTGWFECPKAFVDKLLSGVELGVLMAELSGKPNIKREEGAIGYFTRGVITRTDFYEHGVIMALTKFIAGEKWPK